MSYEDFDGWDESFLDEAIRAEERALAGRSTAQPPAPAEPELPLLAFSGPSFSPPRELSQRVSTNLPAPAFDFFPDGDFEAAQLFPPFPSTASRAVKKNDRNDVEVFSFRFFCDKVCIFDTFWFGVVDSIFMELFWYCRGISVVLLNNCINWYAILIMCELGTSLA